MAAHGNGIEIITYTGGCGTKKVNINPQITLKRGEDFLTVRAELVNAEGAILKTSGEQPLYYSWASWDTIGPIRQIVWEVDDAPSGSVFVKVYALWLGKLTVDTATCRT